MLLACDATQAPEPCACVTLASDEGVATLHAAPSSPQAARTTPVQQGIVDALSRTAPGAAPTRPPMPPVRLGPTHSCVRDQDTGGSMVSVGEDRCPRGCTPTNSSLVGTLRDQQDANLLCGSGGLCHVGCGLPSRPAAALTTAFGGLPSFSPLRHGDYLESTRVLGDAQKMYFRLHVNSRCAQTPKPWGGAPVPAYKKVQGMSVDDIMRVCEGHIRYGCGCAEFNPTTDKWQLGLSSLSGGVSAAVSNFATSIASDVPDWYALEVVAVGESISLPSDASLTATLDVCTDRPGLDASPLCFPSGATVASSAPFEALYAGQGSQACTGATVRTMPFFSSNYMYRTGGRGFSGSCVASVAGTATALAQCTADPTCNGIQGNDAAYNEASGGSWCLNRGKVFSTGGGTDHMFLRAALSPAEVVTACDDHRHANGDAEGCGCITITRPSDDKDRTPGFVATLHKGTGWDSGTAYNGVNGQYAVQLKPSGASADRSMATLRQGARNECEGEGALTRVKVPGTTAARGGNCSATCGP